MRNIKTYREALLKEERKSGPLLESLLYYVDRSDIEGVEDALKSGANPNITDSVGQPVLQLAIQGDNAEIVKLLIDAEADVNRPDDSGS